MSKLSPSVVRRLRGRPYYSYLYARNVLKGRLPASLEVSIAGDPQSAYHYAVEVVGGQLPDPVHAALMMYSLHSKDEGGWVSKYIEFVEGR